MKGHARGYPNVDKRALNRPGRDWCDVSIARLEERTIPRFESDPIEGDAQRSIARRSRRSTGGLRRPGRSRS